MVEAFIVELLYESQQQLRLYKSWIYNSRHARLHGFKPNVKRATEMYRTIRHESITLILMIPTNELMTNTMMFYCNGIYTGLIVEIIRQLP